MSSLLRALQAQPYRRGAVRPAGPALDAMLAGKPALMPNPQDAMRALQRKTALTQAAVRFKYPSGNSTTHIAEDDPLWNPQTMGNHHGSRRKRHSPSARWA